MSTVVIFVEANKKYIKSMLINIRVNNNLHIKSTEK